MTAKPSVVVFDANEALIQRDSPAPVFEQIFGDGQMVRT